MNFLTIELHYSEIAPDSNQITETTHIDPTIDELSDFINGMDAEKNTKLKLRLHRKGKPPLIDEFHWLFVFSADDNQVRCMYSFAELQLWLAAEEDMTENDEASEILSKAYCLEVIQHFINQGEFPDTCRWSNGLGKFAELTVS